MERMTRWLVACAAAAMVTLTLTPALAGVGWTPKEGISLEAGGDFRFRNEFDFVRSNPDDPFRYRARIRARFGGKAKFLDQLELGLRLATGNAADANSPHQTFTDGFGKWTFSLDKAYAKWSPKPLGGSYVMAGKFSHPFVKRPVFNETLWDGDINPSGFALGANVPIGKALDAWKAVGTAYVFAENGGDTTDGVVVTGQTSFHFAFSDAVKLDVAAGMYWIPNTTPGGHQAWVLENQGNATVDDDGDGVADGFAEDFAVIDALVGLKINGPGVGVQVGGQVFVNALADSDNVGFGVGVAVPFKTGHADCTVTPYVDFQRVPQESIFSPWMQDDHQSSLPLQGIIGGVKWKPVKWFQFHAWVLTEQDLANPDDPWATRVRTDFNFKL